MTTTLAIRPTNSTPTLVDQYFELKNQIDGLAAEKAKVTAILLGRLKAGETGIGTLGQVTHSAPNETLCDVETLRGIADEEMFDRLTKVSFSPSAYNAMFGLNLVPAEIVSIVQVRPKTPSLHPTATKR